jgi:ectoine hydroxylase-related dioxygenase (phytanoyl-CoA dioxygenase family)
VDDPGSHARGRPRASRIAARSAGSTPTWSQALGAELVPLEAPAGSVVFFNGDVVHGSRRNRTAASRRAFVLTYQPAGFAQFRRPGARPVSFAGESAPPA